MFLRRRAEPAEGGCVRQWVDPVFQSAHPALHEFLSVVCWDDMTPRQTGTLLLFCEEGRVKAMLNDREQGCVAFLSESTMEGLLEALESKLVEGTMDWRATKGAGDRGQRKAR